MNSHMHTYMYQDNSAHNGKKKGAVGFKIPSNTIKIKYPQAPSSCLANASKYSIWENTGQGSSSKATRLDVLSGKEQGIVSTNRWKV